MDKKLLNGIIKIANLYGPDIILLSMVLWYRRIILPVKISGMHYLSLTCFYLPYISFLVHPLSFYWQVLIIKKKGLVIATEKSLLLKQHFSVT